MVFKKGYKPSEEQRKKQSETRKRLIFEGKIDMKERMANKEIRNKISKTLTGKKHTKKRKENISKAVKEAYLHGRKINSPKKVSIGKIKKCIRDGIQKSISHWIWYDNYGSFPKNGEVIHHIDFNEDNNKISNLRIMKISEHIKLHWRL